MILIINNQQVNLQGGSGRPNWTFRLKKNPVEYRREHMVGQDLVRFEYFRLQCSPNKTPALDINNSNIKLRHDRSQLDESFAMVCHYGHISTLAISDFCGSTS